MKRSEIAVACFVPLVFMLGILHLLPAVLALLMTLLVIMPFILTWIILCICQDDRYTPYADEVL
jgi:hypothetical protein